MFNEMFGSYLYENQVINDAFLPTIQECDKFNIFLYEKMLQKNVCSEEDTYTFLATYIGLEYKDLQLTELDFDIIKSLPREMLVVNQIIPFKQNSFQLFVAIANPLMMTTAQELKYYINKEICFYLVSPSKMQELISYINNRIKQQDVLQSLSSTEDLTNATLSEMSETDAPIIALCDSILKDAVARGASDIHIEPFASEVRVRYRIDGKLLKIDTVKPSLYAPLLARFKIISEMNIAERRVPQDGKISLDISGSRYDFRVNTMPTVHGEKIVIRIYNKTLATSDMSILGFDNEQRNLITSLITRPHGIILLTGPTGSGKSTSLYTFLRYLNRGDVNIVTVEDPVENEIEGISQVQVNPKANLTFASVLRATLRQDPNIIMIGEIRDEETAHIAVRAAITGHLVLSTIHTNSAASVVSRLIDMGIAPYLVADSLLCSISQRLLRKLCPNCKRPSMTTDSEMLFLGIDQPARVYKPCGCAVCSNTGYSGRIGVFEILPVNSKVRTTIMSPAYTSELLQQAIKDDVPSITEQAKVRVLNGETSIEEYSSLIGELENKMRISWDDIETEFKD